MVLLWSYRRRILTLALLTAVCGPAPAWSQNAENAAGSAPTIPVFGSATNATEPLPGQGAFDLFKKDLFQPLDSYGPRNGPRNSVDQFSDVPFRPRLLPLDRKTQELMNQRRNWVFTDLNDLNAVSKPGEGLLNFMPELNRDKLATKKLPPMERYYQEMNKGMGLDTNLVSQAMEMAWTMNVPNATNMVNPAAMLFYGSNGIFKGMLGPGNPDTNTLSVPAYGDPPPTPEIAAREREQKWRLEEFKRLLDPTLPPVPGPSEHVPTPMEKLLNPAPPALPNLGNLSSASPGLPGSPTPAAPTVPGAAVPVFGLPAIGSGASQFGLPANPANSYTNSQTMSAFEARNGTGHPVDLLANPPPKRKF